MPANINSITIGPISGGTIIFGDVGQVCPPANSQTTSSASTGTETSTQLPSPPTPPCPPSGPKNNNMF